MSERPLILSNMDELLNDKRFAHIARDPKFKKIPKTEKEVMVDKRFQSMFKDKKFAVKHTIDKRGRPVNQTSSENLKKYCDLPSSKEEGGKEKKRKKTMISCFRKSSMPFKEDEEDNEIVVIPKDCCDSSLRDETTVLKFITEKLSEEDSSSVQATDEQLYECCKSILDSQYPKYILSRDKKNLSNLSQVLEDHWHVYKDMENLRPILWALINGRSPNLLQKNLNKFYTIEEIKLY